MRVVHFALPLTVSSVVSSALVVVACGGSSANPPIHANDGADATTDNADSGGTHGDDNGGNNDSGNAGNGDSGSSGNGDGGVLASFDASDIPDGGFPVTPHQIPCGATADCENTTNTCCIATDGGADCISGANATCPAQSAAIHCLEAADCPSGQACCGEYSLSAATAQTSCQIGPCGTVQFCRTNGECENDKPCVPQTCAGQSLELCGVFSVPGIVQCTAN